MFFEYSHQRMLVGGASNSHTSYAQPYGQCTPPIKGKGHKKTALSFGCGNRVWEFEAPKAG